MIYSYNIYNQNLINKNIRDKYRKKIYIFNIIIRKWNEKKEIIEKMNEKFIYSYETFMIQIDHFQKYWKKYQIQDWNSFKSEWYW